MRICYLSDERFPSTHTDTQQMAMTMEAMGRAGLDVHLIAPKLTAGPHVHDQPQAMRDYYGVEKLFETHFLRSADPERRGWVKTLHPLLALNRARKLHPRLVYTRNAQIAVTAMAAGYRVAFESYRIIDKQMPQLAKLLGRATSSSRFLGVITHSNVSAEAFQRIGVPSEKIEVIYNGFSMKQMEPRLSRTAARDRLGLGQDRRIAVFAGHIMPKKGLESLAEIAARTPDVDHVWVGGSPDGTSDFGERCAQKAGASNIHITGWLAAADVAPYLYAANALLIPPASSPLQQHGNTVLPMKIYGYLASGRAILAPDLADLRELLTHHDNAWLTPPNDVPKAAESLLKLVGDDASQERLGKAAFRKVQSLTWDSRAKRIRSFLERRLVAAS